MPNSYDAMNLTEATLKQTCPEPGGCRPVGAGLHGGPASAGVAAADARLSLNVIAAFVRPVADLMPGGSGPPPLITP